MFLTSIAAGAIGSIVGIGGGLLVTPVLTLIFGVDIHLAIGASIVAIIATSSGGAVAYIKDRISNIRVGMYLEISYNCWCRKWCGDCSVRQLCHSVRLLRRGSAFLSGTALEEEDPGAPAGGRE